MKTWESNTRPGTKVFSPCSRYPEFAAIVLSCVEIGLDFVSLDRRSSRALFPSLAANTEKAQKKMVNLKNPDKLKYLFNNEFGTALEDAGSQQCEQSHAFDRKTGLVSMTRSTLKSYEYGQMFLQYSRITHNTVLLNKWQVKGKYSGDVRAWQQADAIANFAAVMFHSKFEDQSVSVFWAISGKTIKRKNIEELQAEGFVLQAKGGSPWSTSDKKKMDGAVIRLKEDPTLSGDYKTVERWLSWQVLGGARNEGDVGKRLVRVLRRLKLGKTASEAGSQANEDTDDDEHDEPVEDEDSEPDSELEDDLGE